MAEGRPLGVAVVGSAFMGKAHSNAWRNVRAFYPDVPAVRQQVLVARDAAATGELAARYGWAEAATDWRTVLDRDDVDVVDICLPGHLHAEVAIAALEAGKHVVVEKPLANTVDQALTALEPLLGEGLGLALDSYHLNIEERSSADAVRAAGRHLAHVQVCGSDRGAPGGDQTDWQALVSALDEVGYDGPLVIESFTADNASIATAASIWRPLAPTQDDLARDGLAFLRSLTH